MAKKINVPLSREEARKLKSGDNCLITGTIYTARDAAHKRLCELIKEGKALPFDVKDSVIYYVGPTPAKPGSAIGSAGPTTAYRMDAYSPALIANYVYDLVKEFNSFYQNVSILGEEDTDKRSLRVHLSRKVGEVIAIGFDLLGIEVPERM